jgi:hypothetical protein
MPKETSRFELICDLTGSGSDNQEKQRRRMVLVLVLLFVALVFVIVRWSDVWVQVFSMAASETLHGSPSTIESSPQKVLLSSRPAKRPESPRRGVPVYTSDIDGQITERAVRAHVDILLVLVIIR